MGFLQTMYVVEESAELTFCVQLRGTIEKNVFVTSETEADSAHSKFKVFCMVESLYSI